MRPQQKSNRSRGKSNRKGQGNSANRVYESAGPEGKVRGTPQQIIDKYEQLARDAQTVGDRVVAENFLQHAEHYVRVLGLAQASQPVERRDQPAAQQPVSDEGAEQPPVNGAFNEQEEQPAGAPNGLATFDAGAPTSNTGLIATPESMPQPETGEVPADVAAAPRRRPPRRPRPPRKPEGEVAEVEQTAPPVVDEDGGSAPG